MEGDTMAGGLGNAAFARTEIADDERDLVVRVQRGDKHAFNELARRYARRAFAVAYRILRHTQDAEDLVQDAFVAALNGIGSFDPSRPFSPWFFKIVVNLGLADTLTEQEFLDLCRFLSELGKPGPFAADRPTVIHVPE